MKLLYWSVGSIFIGSLIGLIPRPTIIVKVVFVVLASFIFFLIIGWFYGAAGDWSLNDPSENVEYLLGGYAGFFLGPAFLGCLIIHIVREGRA
jgi:hypothetical protein